MLSRNSFKLRLTAFAASRLLTWFFFEWYWLLLINIVDCFLLWARTQLLFRCIAGIKTYFPYWFPKFLSNSFICLCSCIMITRRLVQIKTILLIVKAETAWCSCLPAWCVYMASQSLVMIKRICLRYRFLLVVLLWLREIRETSYWIMQAFLKVKTPPFNVSKENYSKRCQLSLAIIGSDVVRFAILDSKNSEWHRRVVVVSLFERELSVTQLSII